MDSNLSVKDRMKQLSDASGSAQKSNGSSFQGNRLANRSNNTPRGGSNPNLNAPKNETVTKILNGDESVAWALFTYDKSGLSVHSQGSGDIEELRANLDDAAVLYGYIRIALGSDKRNKYVFLKWVGDDIRPIQRARAFDESKQVMEVIRVYHLEFPVTRKSDLSTQVVTDRLKAAAGANYDKEQNTSTVTVDKSAHEFGNYKRSSKEFFQNMEKNGNLQKVVYDSKPLARTTPVDLGNRQMTVGASSARTNTIDLQTGLKKEEKVAA